MNLNMGMPGGSAMDLNRGFGSQLSMNSIGEGTMPHV